MYMRSNWRCTLHAYVPSYVRFSITCISVSIESKLMELRNTEKIKLFLSLLYMVYLHKKSPSPCSTPMISKNGTNKRTYVLFFVSLPDHWLHVVIKNGSVNLYFNLFYSYLCSRFWSPPKQGTETWVTLLWICWSCGPIPANRAIMWLLARWIDRVLFILNFTWRRGFSSEKIK